MITRQSIVDALAQVEGVTPSLFRPGVVAPGQSWPTMTGWSKVAGRIFEQKWGVYVVLAADDRAAAQQWDLLIPAVVPALDSIMTVDEVQAHSLPVDTGALLCAVVVARSE